MNAFFPLSSRQQNRLLSGLILALMLILALAVLLMPAPQLTIASGDTTAQVTTDRAWALLPNDCFQIRWQHQGSLPIHIDGVTWQGSGEQRYCPQVFAPSPLIELTDHRQGVYQSDRLDIFYLPDVLVNALGLVALAFCPLLAGYYLCSNDLDKRPPLFTILLALCALSLCLAALRMTGRPLSIESVLSILRALFTSIAWQYFGIAITALFFLCLAIQALWQGWRERRVSDLLAVGSCLLFIGLLYLSFGFDTIGHWEEWFGRGFFEGIYRRRLFTEMAQRFSLLWPHGMGFLLSPDSFTGHNLLYALILWGKLALFYGILRCCGLRHLYAYLITMLFGVYPVDAGLMNLRSIVLQFSILNLFAAIYLALQYQRRPTRIRLAGLLLALATSVGAYEAQFILILALPFLWWYRVRKPSWREVNLTIVWYLALAFKSIYLVLIAVSGHSFYRSNYVYAGSEFSSPLSIIENLWAVYLRTFALAWGEAFADLGRNSWLPLTLIMTALVGAVAWYLWKQQDQQSRLAAATSAARPAQKWRSDVNANNAATINSSAAKRKWFLGFLTGACLIVPAVGVLIWFSYYSQDLWRLYLYVPGPAAIAVFCLIALLATRISNPAYRHGALIIACVLLMLPAISRLLLQHEHFVASAENKRRVLQQITQIAPGLGSETRVLVLSNMPEQVRLSKYIEEMKSNMIGSALFVVYDKEVSGQGSMCISVEDCSIPAAWSEHLADTLVFLLHEDLSLELVRDPATIFSEFRDLDYDITALYNPDAPLPQRAYTMLGLARP